MDPRNRFPRWMGDNPMDGTQWQSRFTSELLKNIREGMSITEMAVHQGRTCGAIIEQLKRKDPLFKSYWDHRSLLCNNGYGIDLHISLAFLYEAPLSGLNKWQAEQYANALAKREIKIENKETLDLIAKAVEERIEERANTQEWVKEQLAGHFIMTRRAMLFIAGFTASISILGAATLTILIQGLP